ncbi:hypothetical protein [Nitrobacter sp. TKz-YC02]|uniref:hypothetical protein n=1 Tax=Nitrobacter sp. TKz-YC02 TaxID=3398704 RepID=UPI003CEFAA5A
MTTNAHPDRRKILLAGPTLAITSSVASTTVSRARAERSSLNPQPLPPSPEWARAQPPGPDTSVTITEAYAAMVARDAYFWAWPLVNIFNRRQAFKDTPSMHSTMAGKIHGIESITEHACPSQVCFRGCRSARQCAVLRSRTRKAKGTYSCFAWHPRIYGRISGGDRDLCRRAFAAGQ